MGGVRCALGVSNGRGGFNFVDACGYFGDGMERRAWSISFGVLGGLVLRLS